MNLELILGLLSKWLELLGPLGVIGGIIWKFWLKNRYREAKEVYTKVMKIAEEFERNGGKTIKDAIFRIESKISLQEQKTTALIKSMPLGMWLSDAHGKCIDVNRSLCDIMDRTESEIKGDNWSNWLYGPDKALVYDEWNRCVTNEIDFEMEYTYVLPDSGLQKVHGTAYQLRNEEGKLLGFLGTLYTVGEVVYPEDLEASDVS